MVVEMVGTKVQVTTYSAKVGADPLLIQGAGGNASWKDGETMWIKASGTWLADALKKDIFVPIDIDRALKLIVSGTSDLSTACLGDSQLRPSIETCLHALLPQRVVFHFHSVDVIALAVRKDAEREFSKRLDGLNWAWIDYVKPGPELARVVMAVLDTRGAPDILILGNHGLVIASDSTDQLQALQAEVMARCVTSLRPAPVTSPRCLGELAELWKSAGYVLPLETRCHSLALDPICLDLASSAWVLYPDHAVFLGAFASIAELPNLLEEGIKPECSIVPGRGVVVRQDLSAGQLAMLACYADVTLRISSLTAVSPLTAVEVQELLNWDAEKYRKMLNLV